MTFEDYEDRSWLVDDLSGSQNGLKQLEELLDEYDELCYPAIFSADASPLDSSICPWGYSHEMTVLSTSTSTSAMCDSSVVVQATTYTGDISDVSNTVSAGRIPPRCLEGTSESPSAHRSPNTNDEQPNSPRSFIDFAIKQYSVCRRDSHHTSASGLCTKCSMSDIEAKQCRVERRRNQNRTSQRRYRERKDAKMQAAQDEVQEWKKSYTELQDQCKHLLSENRQLKSHLNNIGAVCATGVVSYLCTSSDSPKSCQSDCHG